MIEDDRTSADGDSKASPLSLNRLREAFAAMLGDGKGQRDEARRVGTAHQSTATDSARRAPYVCEVNPRSVIEAILFVGGADNRSFSPRELAAAMRGVSPAEVEAAVSRLNALYESDETPYTIERTKAGYRMVLRESLSRMRDKFYGRVREAKLSPTALEVLAIIAYNQPVTAADINELRDAPSGAAISILVRRGVVRLDRPAAGGPARYSTTDRFLRLFGLHSLEALPRSEELEKV